MPLRGETVGIAYVRILADGSDMPESIKKELRKSEPDVKRQGKKNTDVYSKAFNDEMKKTALPQMIAALDQGLGRSDAINKAFSQKKINEVTDRLKKEFGNAGIILAAELETASRKAGNFDVATQKLQNVGREIRRIEAQITAAEASEMSQFQRNIRLRLSQSALLAKREAEIVKVQHAARDAAKETAREIERESTRFGRLGIASDHASTLILREGAKIGKIFGKGARNDAINFFGSLMGGIVQSAAVFPKLISKGQQLATTIGEGGLTSALGTAAKALPVFVVAVTAVVTLMGVVVSAVSGAAAAVTALASAIGFGLIGALAPLVGLIPVVVAVMGTLALGISKVTTSNAANSRLLKSTTTAVAKYRAEVAATTPGTKAHTTAVQHLNVALKEQATAQKNVNASIGGAVGGLRNALHSLQDAAATALFAKAPAQIRALKPVIETLKPLVSGVATGISDVFSGFVAGMNSPGFKDFVREMTLHLPDQVRSLGRIFQSTLGGLGGLFVVLQPFADRFLAIIENLARRFSAFTNSAKGRKELTDFFNKAWDSAVKVWNVVTSLGALLGTIFGGGRQTGNDLLTSLADTFTRWNDELKKNPDAIKNFFKNGEKVAKDIGDIVTAIGSMVKALDNPRNQQTAHDLFVSIASAISILATAFGVAALPMTLFIDLIKTLNDVGNAMLGAVRGPIVGWASALGSGFVNANIAIGNFVVGALGAVQHWASSTASNFVNANVAIGHFAASAARSVAGWASSTASNFLHANAQIGHFVAGAASAALGLGRRVLGAIAGIPGQIVALAGRFQSAGSSIIGALLRGLSNAGGFVGSFAAGIWNSLRSSINHAIDTINRNLVIHIPLGPDINPPDIPYVARGGVFSRDTLARIAESGAEAVVPLNRPLALVDPSVRALSAFAQGLAIPGQSTTNHNRNVDASGWTIVTPTEDPRRAADEIVNRLAAAAI